MFGDLYAGPCSDKRGRGGNIKRPGAVAAGAHDVNGVLDLDGLRDGQPLSAAHHSGSNAGWQALIVCQTESRRGLVVLTNSDNGGPVLLGAVCTWARSEFDVVLPDPIPGKGRVLTDLSTFWFARTAGVVANHLASRGVDDVLSGAELESVREFCAYIETPLTHILETFRPGDDLLSAALPYDRAAIFYESLGLSPADKSEEWPED